MCPPGSQGACLDIYSTYWNFPLLLAHKAYIASMWCKQIYIDHCAMEGLSSASNIQGSPADALITIFKSKSIDEVMKWADDFVFFCTQIDDQIHPLPSRHTNMAMIIINTINNRTAGCSLASHWLQKAGLCPLSACQGFPKPTPANPWPTKVMLSFQADPIVQA